MKGTKHGSARICYIINIVLAIEIVKEISWAIY